MYWAASWVAEGGQSKAIQILLDAGADPDIQNEHGRTALHGAAALGRSEVVQILVDAGADPDIKDNNGETALVITVETGRLEIAQILVDAGAKKGGLKRRSDLRRLLRGDT